MYTYMIMGITGACSRLIGDVLHAFGSSRPPSAVPADHDHERQSARKVDDPMVRALITVFGMENNGRIKKEKARRVAEKLGFEVDDEGDGDDDGDEVAVEGMEEVGKRKELLHEAFKIFDEDGDGYIEAVELKRVLDCLGLDGGWEMGEIEKMVRVVDLNLDGKVDFGEFQLMMMN
jgi:Ca2+-binding EF-hand superfamily protein